LIFPWKIPVWICRLRAGLDCQRKRLAPAPSWPATPFWLRLSSPIMETVSELQAREGGDGCGEGMAQWRGRQTIPQPPLAPKRPLFEAWGLLLRWPHHPHMASRFPDPKKSTNSNIWFEPLKEFFLQARYGFPLLEAGCLPLLKRFNKASLCGFPLLD
jgi:hypothetical protein